MMKDTSKPTRKPLFERWDLLPWQGIAWAARAMWVGFAKRGRSDWREYPTEGDEAPINHAMRHLARATTLRSGSMERLDQYGRVIANVAMQIELEAPLQSGAVAAWQNRMKDLFQLNEEQPPRQKATPSN